MCGDGQSWRGGTYILTLLMVQHNTGITSREEKRRKGAMTRRERERGERERRERGEREREREREEERGRERGTRES